MKYPSNSTIQSSSVTGEQSRSLIPSDLFASAAPSWYFPSHFSTSLAARTPKPHTSRLDASPRLYPRPSTPQPDHLSTLLPELIPLITSHMRPNLADPRVCTRIPDPKAGPQSPVPSVPRPPGSPRPLSHLHAFAPSANSGTNQNPHGCRES